MNKVSRQATYSTVCVVKAIWEWRRMQQTCQKQRSRTLDLDKRRNEELQPTNILKQHLTQDKTMVSTFKVIDIS